MFVNRRLTLLRKILAVKVVITLFCWGMPTLLAPRSLFQLLGVPAPEDPLFLRLFGAVVIALGIAYWYAYRDPIRNIAILKTGIVDNGLVTLTILVFTVHYDLRSVFLLISGLLTFFFFISFILLLPRTERS